MKWLFFLKIICSNMLCKIRFKKVGRRSFCFNPMRIVGGQYIGIGESTSIMKGLRIEAIDEYNGEMFTPSISIGNFVNIEQNVHITCAYAIEIEDEVSILPDAMITDIVHPYENINIAPKYQKIESRGKVIIGKQTMVGTGSKIMPGVKIGKHCVIGANSVVTKDIPDYCIAIGCPAKIVKRYDEAKGNWKRVMNTGDNGEGNEQTK